MDAELHYDANYFSHYLETFKFGGWAELIKFEPYIEPTDTVVDFGCGGGYLLDHLRCARKLGVELNPVARGVATGKGHEVYERTESLPDECADVIISNHVLEHTIDPLGELTRLHAKLKPGGKLILVVPCEGVSTKFQPDNVDFHLFTWSPLNLGNLLVAADFKVLESRRFVHRWPPKARVLAGLFGRKAFDFICYVHNLIRPSQSQVRAIAIK